MTFKVAPPRKFDAAHLNKSANAAPEFAPAEPGAFQRLREESGRPWRVAILSDFIRVTYANGAVFQTRSLYRQLREAGHEASIVGPADPQAAPGDLAPDTFPLPSLPVHTYPGLRLPLPPWSVARTPERFKYDLVFAQTQSLLMLLGVWLRQMHGTPLLCVNTTHLVAAYDVLLPQALAEKPLVHEILQRGLRRPFERLYASIYNSGDGLVVLSEGLREYWRQNGVTVPIHVVPRAVQREFREAPPGPDPFVELLGPELSAERGLRLMVSGRHLREKSQDRLIRIFARHVLPQEPGATLTLVGHGPDTGYYQKLAQQLGVAHRVFFTGEVPFAQMPGWYRHAGVFVHASLSETFGNVLNEALWCGCPVVAFEDRMGVSSQMLPGDNGLTVAPGENATEREEADLEFGRAVLSLVRNPALREQMGHNAARIAERRSSPRAVEERLCSAFRDAREHAAAQNLKPLSEGPAMRRWLATLTRFPPWAVIHLAVYLAGLLRPAKGSPDQVRHPRIWT